MTEESENKQVSIIKSSSQFGLTTLISRLTGFLRDVLFANYFGAGANTDAFFVLLKYRIFLEDYLRKVLSLSHLFQYSKNIN